MLTAAARPDGMLSHVTTWLERSPVPASMLNSALLAAITAAATEVYCLVRDAVRVRASAGTARAAPRDTRCVAAPHRLPNSDVADTPPGASCGISGLRTLTHGAGA